MPSRRDDHGVWQEVARSQGCLISRAQLVSLGFSGSLADQRLRSGRWAQVHPGVYLTMELPGPLDDLARVWAGVLFAGPGAAASHATAAWLFGVLDQLPYLIEVSVPQPRQVARRPGLRVRRAQRLGALVHPALQPPRTRIEVAVLDTADSFTRPEPVIDVVLRAIQRRLTVAARLREELGRRSRHRWRTLLTQVLADVDDGVASVLERRYARDVERAHGLPRGQRNRPDPEPGQRFTPGRRGNRYRDVRYLRWRTVVELDGLEAHPREEAFRDHRRDNELQLRAEAVLRYGWRDVTAHRCQVAQQVAAVLQLRGWPGQLRRCGPSCSASS